MDCGRLAAAALVLAAAGIGCSKTVPPPDGNPPANDAGVLAPDAGKDAGSADAAAPGKDAGGSRADSGAGQTDAEVPLEDAGGLESDAGGLESDAGGAGADAGSPGTDAGGMFGTEVVRSSIGSGQGQIGVDTAEESWQAGPMSFAVATNGEIFVLDQVNSRINVYSNGSFLRSVPIGGTTYVDMDLMNSGGFVLLDNLVQKKVIVLNTVGTKVHEIALQGSGIPEPAAALGVQYRGDGIWVEMDDDTMVQVGNSDGTAATNRVTVQGLFTWDSSRLMTASVLGDITASVSVSAEDKVTWSHYTVNYSDHPIFSLLGLCSDASGNFYLGTLFSDSEGAPSEAELTVLNSSGEVVKRTPIFAQTRTEEVRRSLRVTSDGTAYQLALDDKGAAVRRYDP